MQISLRLHLLAQLCYLQTTAAVNPQPPSWPSSYSAYRRTFKTSTHQKMSEGPEYADLTIFRKRIDKDVCDQGPATYCEGLYIGSARGSYTLFAIEDNFTTCCVWEEDFAPVGPSWLKNGTFIGYRDYKGVNCSYFELTTAGMLTHHHFYIDIGTNLLAAFVNGFGETFEYSGWQLQPPDIPGVFDLPKGKDITECSKPCSWGHSHASQRLKSGILLF